MQAIPFFFFFGGGVEKRVRGIKPDVALSLQALAPSGIMFDASCLDFRKPFLIGKR